MCLAMEGIEEDARLEGKNLRDREKISEMLRDGKSVEDIVNFCKYPEELVREVDEEKDKKAKHTYDMSKILEKIEEDERLKGKKIRDIEKILDMLGAGKSVGDIVDFCKYPKKLVKKVKKCLKACED